jgi:hypothetical protein
MNNLDRFSVMASLTIRPGARVRLKGQNDHVPDFYVVRCEYDRCWIRQMNWNPEVSIDVQFSQLFIPDPSSILRATGGGSIALPTFAPLAPAVANPPQQPDNVIYMAAYRRRKAR